MNLKQINEIQNKELKHSRNFFEDLKIKSKYTNKVLDIVKKIDKDKIKKGFRFMVKDKISVLTHPKNFKQRLEEGFKFNIK